MDPESSLKLLGNMNDLLESCCNLTFEKVEKVRQEFPQCSVKYQIVEGTDAPTCSRNENDAQCCSLMSLDKSNCH